MTRLSGTLSAEAFCATQQRDLSDLNLRTFLESPDLLAAGTIFATTLWEQLLELVDGAVLTSGFRCVELNARIGGSRPPAGKLSAHVFARAADCVPTRVSLLAAMELLALSSVRFDKAILEGVGLSRWLHIQIPQSGRVWRRQMLVTYGDRDAQGRLVYSAFQQKDPRAQVFA